MFDLLLIPITHFVKHLCSLYERWSGSFMKGHLDMRHNWLMLDPYVKSILYGGI